VSEEAQDGEEQPSGLMEDIPALPLIPRKFRRPALTLIVDRLARFHILDTFLFYANNVKRNAHLCPVKPDFKGKTPNNSQLCLLTVSGCQSL